MLAFYLVPSSRSKITLKADSFSDESKCTIQRVLILISTGITSSTLNVKLKGVFFVPECMIVLIAHKMLDNSLIQRHLASSNLFLRKKRFFCSLLQSSLLFGLWYKSLFKLMYKLLQNWVMWSPFNCGPLSIIILYGTPNL